jgi:predicted kinase
LYNVTKEIKVNKVYVLVGVPGAGKSTWIADQLWAKDCVYISSDQLVEEEAYRRGKTYNDVFKDYINTAIAEMLDKAMAARDAGKDIIWDQTSVSVKSRRKKFSVLPDYEHIAIVFDTPNEDELRRRLSNRPGKTIPWEVVSSMIKNFEMPTEEEGFKEIWRAG